MKRFNDDNYWFELAHGPDPTTGRSVRFLTIRCRECQATISHHAHGMSNERLRKHFMRRHWFVGKTTTGHLCPRCHRKEVREAVVSVPVAVVPPPPGELYDMWAAASREKRLEFLLTLATEPQPALYALLRELGFELGFLANSRKPEPTAQPVEPEPEPSVITQPEPEPEPDDDDPADWWRELEEKTTHHNGEAA